MTAPGATAQTKPPEPKPLAQCAICGGERDSARYSQCARCLRDDRELGEDRS